MSVAIITVPFTMTDTVQLLYVVFTNILGGSICVYELLEANALTMALHWSFSRVPCPHQYLCLRPLQRVHLGVFILHWRREQHHQSRWGHQHSGGLAAKRKTRTLPITEIDFREIYFSRFLRPFHCFECKTLFFLCTVYRRNICCCVEGNNICRNVESSLD